MSILDEIEEIAKKEFDSWTNEQFMNGIIRLITIELFLRVQEDESGTLKHVFLTSTNHPLLLNIFTQTEYIPFSNDLLDALTEAYAKILDISIEDVADIISTLIGPEIMEGDSEY